jgi:acyl-CoA synthetase (NDP forming)
MIDFIFNPSTVAVIGASNNPDKWGNWIADGLLKHKDKRSVYLVDKNKSIKDLPQALDLAVICVAVDEVEPVVDQLLEINTKAIICITAGFSERGNGELEQRIVDKAKSNGTVFIGPNCAGIWDANTPIDCLPLGEFTRGSVGVISQSGGLVVDLAERLKPTGMGFSRVITVGNQNGVDLKDIIQSFVDDIHTEIIAMYYEDVDKIPFEYIQTLSKPLVLYVPWATPAAIRAAKRHTGSNLSIALNVARNMMDFTAVIQYINACQPRSAGKRTMLVTDTGGYGVMLSTSAEFNSLLIDEPSEQLVSEIASVLSKESTAANPIDMVGSSAGFTKDAVEVMKILQRSDEVDNIIMHIHVERDTDQDYLYAIELARAVREGGKPVIFTCYNYNASGVKALLKNRMVVCRDPDVATTLMNNVCN